MDFINAVGRRKASVARVYLRKGTGKVEINGKALAEYFPMPHIRSKVMDPLQTVGLETAEYDLIVNVLGGGFKGQAEAVRMGVSRVLVKLNEDFRKSLKERKFLTRDAREVERKKFGKPKARKSFQFSKR
ncbi:MAG: 30S ribosomal protein S9 [Saprospiraceae bacterium]|jgi:small subunit ribosomal protein S9|nr:30S ribosomal protein S9 [Saprospiraceae bacterium]